MKKEFFDAIRSGAKTTTLRYWRRCQVRAETLQTVPGLGRVRIESVRRVEPDELTDEDARADGFADLGAMVRALSDIYPPDERSGRTLYQVRFSLVR